MSISLPPVIKAIELAAIAADAVKPEFEAKLDLGLKKYIFVITRDINEEDRRVLEDYGKVVEYNDRIHANMPIDAYRWEYLIFDMRESEDRYALMRMVIPNRAKYNIIVYSYAFERDEIIPDADNHITSFPKIQAKREDYECLLMQKRLVKPRWYVSLFSCLLQAYHSVKK